jgi:hypothetical protein
VGLVYLVKVLLVELEMVVHHLQLPVLVEAVAVLVLLV